MYTLESILSLRLSKQEPCRAWIRACHQAVPVIPMCLGYVSDPRTYVGILAVYFKWVYILETVKLVLRNLIVFQNPYSRKGPHIALHFLSMSPVDQELACISDGIRGHKLVLVT